MLLVITLPIAVSAQIVKVNGDQFNNVGNEIERKLTEPPTITDVIGEDIVLSIGEYQPNVLRAGLVEDQGAPVYARLIGTTSNPSVTIPRINGIDIVSQRVTTIPEGLPVSISRVAYIPPQDGLIALSNMGNLVVFINRIPKEDDVPDEITVNLDARVRFDVSSGLGASPTKMVLREEDYGEWSNHKSDNKYMDVYINAKEVGNDYVVLDVYDENSNEIARDVKIGLNDNPRSFRRTPRIGGIYAPHQLFDRFTIDLREVKSAGKTLDVLIVKDGVAETQTISEGEAVYPGSSVFLEDVDEDGEWVIAKFRGPSNQPENKKIARFPKKKVTSIINATQSITGIDQQKKTLGAENAVSLALANSSDVTCTNGLKMTDIIASVAQSLPGSNTEQELLNLLQQLKPCMDSQNVLKEQGKALLFLLSEIRNKAVVGGQGLIKVKGTAEAYINNFAQTYNTNYPESQFSLTATQQTEQSLELYNLAVAEYDAVVATFNDEVVAYPDNSTRTTIADFQAQYNKALLLDAKLKDPYKAREAYKKLLEMFYSYKDPQKIVEARTLIHENTIENRIATIDSVLASSSQDKTVAQIDMFESNGQKISILLDNSNLRDYALEEKTSTAKIKVTTPQGSPAEQVIAKEVREGMAIPFSTQTEIVWTVKQILSDAIIITTSSGDYKDIKIQQGKIGTDVPIKSGVTQRIILENTQLYKEAHLVVSPNIESTFSGAHFSMHIPIEKRALDLPLFTDSISEEINKTEELIAKLDEVIAKVGKVHDAWKKFCFGVFAAIASWNFLKSVFGAGEGRAKQEASEVFWQEHSDKCVDDSGRPLTFDECVFKFEDEYNKIVSTTEKAYDEADKVGKQVTYGNFKVTDQNREDIKDVAKLESVAKANPSNEAAQKGYVTALFNLQNREDQKAIILSYNSTDISKSEKQQKIFSDVWVKKQENLQKLREKYPQQASFINQIEISDSLNARLENRRISQSDLRPISNLTTEEKIKLEKARIELHKRRIISDNPNTDQAKAEQQAKQEVTDLMAKENFVYFPPNAPPVYFETNTPESKSTWQKIQELLGQSQSSALIALGGQEYTVTDKDLGEQFVHEPSVTYYEDGPNKGQVHRITIDAFRYAEVEYTTGGRISNVYVFSRTSPNAQIKGDNSETGLNGGPMDVVLKNAKETSNNQLLQNLNRVEGCISELNRAKSSGRDVINCGDLSYGITNDPEPRGTACVNFYSPTQCKLLFNACDPVLCPASRCDLGGTWRVKDDNVIQTGLIGSSVLCLSNFGIPGTDLGFEGGQVVMPICITGIYAGLQNIQTVLMEYSDCLNRAVVEGESVGICDLIRSYYICDILWKEAVAIFNIKGGVLGKIIKFVNGEDEGTEYTDVDASMDTAINGLKYFTQDYAKTTFAQFSGGSLPEIGGEICKSAIFGKLPGVGTFTDQLLRPESPPQFTALLDKVPYQDIQGQPEAEYQVYYRMFAGTNEPISFSVYLKFQDLQGGGAVLPLIPNKALPAGAFDADTINFRAIDVYNQVCIAYSSPTYGYREECGFGKTSSGFALEYAANQIAEKQAKEYIQTAEECAPSGSRFTSPNAGIISNTGKIIAGGFASGVLDTGIIRVCSGVPPGDEKDWKRVGECWEDGPNQGRNLGYCWLHIPTAEKIVEEYQKYPTKYSNLTIAAATDKLSDKAIENMVQYAKNLGIDIGFLSPEEITQAESDIAKEMAKVPPNYKEAVNIYKDVIDSPVIDSARILEFRMKLAQTYKEWAYSLERADVTSLPPLVPPPQTAQQPAAQSSQQIQNQSGSSQQNSQQDHQLSPMFNALVSTTIDNINTLSGLLDSGKIVSIARDESYHEGNKLFYSADNLKGIQNDDEVNFYKIKNIGGKYCYARYANNEPTTIGENPSLPYAIQIAASDQGLSQPIKVNLNTISNKEAYVESVFVSNSCGSLLPSIKNDVNLRFIGGNVVLVYQGVNRGTVYFSLINDGPKDIPAGVPMVIALALTHQSGQVIIPIFEDAAGNKLGESLTYTGGLKTGEVKELSEILLKEKGSGSVGDPNGVFNKYLNIDTSSYAQGSYTPEFSVTIAPEYTKPKDYVPAFNYYTDTQSYDDKYKAVTISK